MGLRKSVWGQPLVATLRAVINIYLLHYLRKEYQIHQKRQGHLGCSKKVAALLKEGGWW
jgi:hypothetical protein